MGSNNRTNEEKTLSLFDFLNSKLNEIQAEPVVASVTRFGSVGYVSKMERLEFGYVQKDKNKTKIRSFGRSKNQKFSTQPWAARSLLQQMGVDMAEPGVGLSRLPQNRSLKLPKTSNPPRKNRKSLAHWLSAATPLPPALLVNPPTVAIRLKLKARPPLVVEHSVRQWVFGTFTNIFP